MKGLVDSIKESVFDPIKTYSDILTPGELDYKFKVVLLSPSVVKNYLDNVVKHYQKDPDETAKLLKRDIVIDKLLVKNQFSNRNKSKLSLNGIDYGELYFHKSPINRNGYCVIFDPYSQSFHNWNFLVTKAASAVGKTLKPIEWVEPKDNEEKNHQYDEFPGVERTFYDNIEDAWEYIEKKYGRF